MLPDSNRIHPQETGPRDDHVSVGGVRLHWLDWGGGGEPVVLLPGMGQGAHVFRALAPLLAPRLRVLALSPRGHGPSGTPPRGYSVRDFAEEVVGFLDAVGLERAALAGHSMAGPVITRCAAGYPDRVTRLVYLDAVLDRAGWGRVQGRRPFHAPPAPLSASDTDDAEREWMRRHVYGFWNPALEADWRSLPPHEERARRRDLMLDFVDDAIHHPPPYGRVRAPALALVAAETAATHFPWLDPGDAASRGAAEAYLREVRQPWRRGAVESFRREVPDARVVECGEHHFLHLAHPERVAEAMLAWFAEGGR